MHILARIHTPYTHNEKSSYLLVYKHTGAGSLQEAQCNAELNTRSTKQKCKTDKVMRQLVMREQHTAHKIHVIRKASIHGMVQVRLADADTGA